MVMAVSGEKSKVKSEKNIYSYIFGWQSPFTVCNLQYPLFHAPISLPPSNIQYQISNIQPPLPTPDSWLLTLSYSSRNECPVKCINTSSIFAFFTSLGLSNPPATSLSIMASGESRATIRPASMMAIRSQRYSASSM